MTTPDFEKMASEFWQAVRDKRAVSLVAVLESAYDAGLERAAEISDAHVTQEDSCSNAEWAQGISSAICAEKSQ